jgi:hypothetical protein
VLRGVLARLGAWLAPPAWRSQLAIDQLWVGVRLVAVRWRRVQIDPTGLGLGLLFPLVILAFLPVRAKLLPQCFPLHHLEMLDRRSATQGA